MGMGKGMMKCKRRILSWENWQLDENYIVIPSNMKPGIFTHASADNWNRATDSVTGKHLHIINMVLFQDSSTQSENFGDVEVADRTRRRSVCERAHRTSQILQCPILPGKNQGSDHLKPEVSTEWFFQCSRDHEISMQVDIAWVFLRLCPGKLYDINFERTGNQKMPGWTVFIQ